MSWLWGKRSSAQTAAVAKKSILEMRSTIEMLEKRERHIQNQIDAEQKKAKENITKNRKAAEAAIKRKRYLEAELDKASGQKLTLETQVNALESANINMATMEVMKQGASAMKAMHGTMNIDKVDATMDQVREQIDLANEVSDAISQPIGMGADVDMDEVAAELEELEQEELDNKLLGAERPPTRLPSVANGEPAKSYATEEDEEEAAELAALQASMMPSAG